MKKPFFIIRIFFFLLLLSGSTLAQQTPDQFPAGELVYQKHEGASYITNKGGDLGKLLQRTRTKDAVGSFTINITGELPKFAAQLSIYAFDVDEERGETLTIYLNNQYIGKVSGTNDTWNTSVFDLEKGLLVKGENHVRFVISDSSKKGTIKWSGKIGWGQIMIDGGAAESGRITEQALSHQQETEQFQTSIKTDIKAEVTGEFILEISMLDEGNNTVTASKKELILKKGEHRQVPIDLSYSPKVKEGRYQIVTNFFYRTGGYLRQQDIRKSTFQLQKRKPITTELIVNTPIKNIDTTEDTKPIVVRLNTLFSFDQNGKIIQAGESLIEKSVVGNSNSALISTQIKGEELILKVADGVSGEAEILLQGDFESKSILSGFLVRVNPKPTEIPIQPLPVPAFAEEPKALKPATPPLPVEPNVSELLKTEITVQKKVEKPKTSLPVPQAPTIPEKAELTIKKGPLSADVSTGLQFLQEYRSAAYIGVSAGREFSTKLGPLGLELFIQQTVNKHEHRTIDSAISVQSLGLVGVYSFFVQNPHQYSPFSQNPLTIRLKGGILRTDYQEHESPEGLLESLVKSTVDLYIGLQILNKINEQHKLFFEIKRISSNLSTIGFGYQFPISF